jgi:Hint domain
MPSGTIISGNYAIGITLTSTGENPVSVTGKITNVSSIALYGTGGGLYNWTVSNSGEIGSTGTAGIGLGAELAPISNGVVTNSGGGVIYGANQGVQIYGPGTVTNLSGGSITGTSFSAVYVSGGTGAVVNTGNLLGGTYGVDESAGGSVSNLSGATKGTITGTGTAGVHIAGGLGTIINAGIILGGVSGTDEFAGGSVTNQAGGSITGSGTTGVYIHGGAGAVVNSGVVLGGTFGVNEQVGGSVTNLSTGVITDTSPEGEGVRIIGGSGAVYNAHSITGGYIGVFLGDGGSVTNVSGGTIKGSATVGVAITVAAGTVFNTGSIYGGYQGVVLADGGSITNNLGGTITGVDKYGIDVAGITGAIVNAGSVYGGYAGVYFDGGGTLTNQAGATISTGAAGIDGVLSEGAATITNAGAIDAGIPTGVAVQLGGPGSFLIVDPGATFSGQVVGAAGDTIELASGTVAGSLAGFNGTSITNFTSLQFEPSALWTISGTSGATGLGTIDIGGFSVGDTIDLTDFAVPTSVSYNTGVLTLTNSTTTTALNMTGGFVTADFRYGTDGSTGTDLTVTVTATCFAAGTRIRTTDGEVAVEKLCEGDQVLTVSGRAQPIRWIGHRHVNFLNHPNRRRILPVRIAAHAFGPGLPERALVLSPDHAVFVEDVLIPIRHLVNGTTVTQIDCDTTTYYHIELPRHDVLLAEGMPAESYLEAGARDAFANSEGAIQLYPEFEPPRDRYAMLWESEAYAPLVVSGELLDRVRCRLAALAGRQQLKAA